MPGNHREADVCGAILAGGMSLRMGRDKAFIEINGRPMITRLVNLLACLTDQIIISANDHALFEHLGFPVVADIYAGQGPLAGLHAVMAHSPRPLVLLLACDLPGIHKGLLHRLIDLSDGFDAVIPRSTDGLTHPLCAVYRRTCMEFIEANLARHKNKMVGFLEDSPLTVRWLESKEGSFVDQDLFNLNSPKDLDDYIASIT